MSLKYLHIFLIFRLAFTGFSLALGYPNQRTPSEYMPISPPSYRQPGHKPSPEHQQLFLKPRMPIILRHPETLKKPLVNKHRPSPDVQKILCVVVTTHHLLLARHMVDILRTEYRKQD
ncbi:hypothetical protein POM88_026564 [Heracleum sosnowskyi]|uniref:Secreted protein n=1 Tax=Heracleum sosnowskyi TaxID=360622 RepID=A0AAD8I735_9APIA|nr:hypothetical protein POM88_026564 [Heracleum sosnowskyi]